jgi:hypothetical protein
MSSTLYPTTQTYECVYFTLSFLSISNSFNQFQNFRSHLNCWRERRSKQQSIIFCHIQTKKVRNETARESKANRQCPKHYLYLSIITMMNMLACEQHHHHHSSAPKIRAGESVQEVHSMKCDILRVRM